MQFDLICEISESETIAAGNSLRLLPVLRGRYRTARWRKLKGVASVHYLLVQSGVPKDIGLRRMALARRG